MRAFSTLALLAFAPFLATSEPIPAPARDVEARQAGDCHVNRDHVATWVEDGLDRRRVRMSAEGIEPDTYCKYWHLDDSFSNIACYYNGEEQSWVVEMNTVRGPAGSAVFYDKYAKSLREWWSEHHCSTG